VPEYEGLSIGVVGLLGDHQAKEIETLLQRFVDASEYKKRRIICGSAAHFQGDERDVMFLSMVYSPNPEGPHFLQEGDDLKRRYNVAASRARDQMWLVHSLDAERDLKPADVRRRLLVHAQDPQSSRVRQHQERTESDFERRVLNALVEKGYRVRSQVEVGAFRLDLVVEGSRNRVAIECDGDRFHPIEQLDADLARQAILERLGWRFIRVRGSAYYRDPLREMRRVYDRLKEANVLPLGPEPVRAITTELPKSAQSVLAKAAELRALWLAGGLGIDHLFENVESGRRRRGAPRFASLSSEVGSS
jgi:very-short-patch-repair endonuclease